MADAAGIAAITGATAVLSGLVGYATSRAQVKLDTKRLEGEAEREGRSVGRADRADKAADMGRRRELYLRYLEEADRLWQFRQLRITEVNYEEIAEWWMNYERLDNEIELTATETVREATYPLWSVLGGYVEAAGEADDIHDVRDALMGHDEMDDLNESRRNLVSAMREDVTTL